MIDEMQGDVPVKSQGLLDYMSTPVLLNQQNDRHDSRQQQGQIDTSLQRNDLRLQFRTSESALLAKQSSEYQLFSLSQSAIRRSSNDQRPHSFSSWRGLLNIQKPGAREHIHQGVQSGSRSLFASLPTVVSRENSSSVVAVTPDTSATSVSHSLLHIQDTYNTSFKDIPGDSFKDTHRDAFKDIRTVLFRDTNIDSFKDIRCSSSTDVTSNSFTGIHSHSIEDITNDSFTDVSSDSFTTMHSDSSFTEIHGDSFEDITNESLTDASMDSFRDKSGNTFKDTHMNSLSGIPQDFVEDTPNYLFKYTQGCSYTDKPGGQYTDTSGDVYTDTRRYFSKNTPRNSLEDTPAILLKDKPRLSLKDTPRLSLKVTPRLSFKDTPTDSLKDTLRDSLKDTPGVLLKNIPEVSLKDAPADSLKNASKYLLKDAPEDSPNDTSRDYYTDQSNNHKTTKSEDTSKVKLSTNGIATAVYFSEHQFLETASPLTHQHHLPASKRESPSHPSISLSLLGLLANFLLIGPCVVIFWNSTWSFFDYILLDQECQVSVWTSAAIGFPCMTVATFLQGSLLSYSTRCNSFFRFILSRTYTYIVSVACVNQWRSVWLIADCYVGSSLFNSGVTFATVFLVLLLSRCLMSMVAPPVILAMEVPHIEHYKVNTFRGIKPTCSVSYLVDTIISVFVVHVAVITYWRSMWEILDFCLFPQDRHLSAVSSVGVGVGLSCLMLVLQRPIIELSRYCHATSWLIKLMFHDLVAVVYSVVCITYWRGVWILLDLYTPHRPNSLYIAHSISFIVLVICLAANSILVRNVDRDGGACAVLDVRYVTTMIHTIRHKPVRVSFPCYQCTSPTGEPFSDFTSNLQQRPNLMPALKKLK